MEGLGSRLLGFRGFQGFIWKFPKIGDPKIVPSVVGSLLQGPPLNRYPVP